MINIIPTNSDNLVKKIITNDKLWILAGYSGKKEEFMPNMDNLWLEIQQNTVITGLFELRRFNTITFEIHPYVLPEHQHTGLSLDALNKLQEFLKENYKEIKNLISYVPISCTHSIKFLEKTNSKISGLIKNGIIYNNQLQDLLLYQLEV